MARYIDADKAMEEINRIGGHNLCEWETIGVKALIDRQPTADVVPRAEAENYKSIAEHQQKLSMDRYFEIKQLKQELDRAKADAAMEIFTEIDKVIKEHSQGYCCDWYLYELIAKLKKKYTEGEK